MKSLFACAALVALAACNSQETAEAQAAEAPAAATAVAAPLEPSMSPPDEEVFATAYAEACTAAPKVSTSLCKSAGFGKEGFVCDYGLGDDEYRRNSATLVPEDGKWVLAEAEKICAADAA
jgi:hypothetical protein